LTALLAPVRAELDRIEAESAVTIEREEAAGEGSYDAIAYHDARGSLDTVKSIRAVLDRLNPEADTLVILGIAALGMLRELRDSGNLSVHANRVEGGPAAYEDWHKRADALLAAAYPKAGE
jgi:hypothetical protein